MNRNEVIDLFTLAAVYDQRTVGDEDADGWLFIAHLDRWTFPAARRVLLEHYRVGADRPRLTAAAVTDGIRAARRLAAESFRVPDTPDDLPAAEYPTWYRAQLAAHLDHHLNQWATGQDLPRAAIEPAGPPAIGSAPAHLRDQIARDITRIGAGPTPGAPVALPHRPTRDPYRRAQARAELDALAAAAAAAGQPPPDTTTGATT